MTTPANPVRTGAEARRYLDPAVVARLAHLDVRARLVVEGFIAGMHRSPFHGFSVEFAEHRPYMPGDPLKNLDWKVLAKSDRYLVKQYTEETNLRCHLLVDLSGSMNFQSPRASLSKLEYARSLAAALAYLMLGQQDAVGALMFADRPLSFIPARSVRSHLDVLLKALAAGTPQGPTRLGPSLHELAERIKRRGLVVLLSDLMDKPEEVLSGLQHFRHRHHEVIVFHILDPDEIEFPYHDTSTFVDLESGTRLTTEPWEIGARYRERLEAWRERYRRACREQLVDYVPLDTRTPFDRALMAYLEKEGQAAVTFRALAWITAASGALALTSALSLLGESPGVAPDGEHLRRMKERTDAPASVQPMTLQDFMALPHDLPVAARAVFERRGVSIEGWNQRMMLAGDGDLHLEITPAPRGAEGADTAYVTAEVTPRWRTDHAGWSYDRLVDVFRPNRGGTTRWEDGPRRVRVSGWLLYDYQYDARPSAWALANASCRVTGWEIHPVTRIELWDDARRGWTEVAR